MNYNNTLYYGVFKTQIGTYSQIQSVSSIANNALNIANNANANANSRAIIINGSYTGTGDTSNTLTFPYAPKFVSITGESWFMVTVSSNPKGITMGSSGQYGINMLTWSGTQLTIFNESSYYNLNNSNINYYYIAIC